MKMSVSYKNPGGYSYRSRGERMIGAFLEDAGLAFRYEPPLLVEDKGRVRIWHPDFFLPDYRTVIEYFGVKDRPEYQRMKNHKVRVYRENSIPAVYVTPDDFERHWQGDLLDRVGALLKRRAGHFDLLRKTYEQTGVARNQPREPKSYEGNTRKDARDV